jgi:hypothetical protein
MSAYIAEALRLFDKYHVFIRSKHYREFYHSEVSSMNLPILYSEYIPALMAFMITLGWFCLSITIPDEPPVLFTWGAMISAVLGAATLFFLSPVFAWLVFAVQIVFSVVLVRWLMHEKSTNSFSFWKKIKRDLALPPSDSNQGSSSSYSG